jgi:hypothetical protein
MRAPNIPQRKLAGMTVGSLRYLLEGLDDLTPIGVQWEDGEVPGDHAPAVQVFGFEKRVHDGEPCVTVRCGLVWLEDDE